MLKTRLTNQAHKRSRRRLAGFQLGFFILRRRRETPVRTLWRFCRKFPPVPKTNGSPRRWCIGTNGRRYHAATVRGMGIPPARAIALLSGNRSRNHPTRICRYSSSTGMERRISIALPAPRNCRRPNTCRFTSKPLRRTASLSNSVDGASLAPALAKVAFFALTKNAAMFLSIFSFSFVHAFILPLSCVSVSRTVCGLGEIRQGEVAAERGGWGVVPREPHGTGRYHGYHNPV